MAWGGGKFLTMNKVIPGAYINFVSRARASFTMSDRGILACPLYLDWGETGKVVTVTPDMLQNDSMKVFGYAYDAPQLLPVREMFAAGIRQLLYYRLAGETAAATCVIESETVATAKYGGSRGNAFRLTVEPNVDDSEKWNVKFYIGTDLIDAQYGVTSAELADNDFVTFNKNAVLSAVSFAPFSGGTNETPTTAVMQNALAALCAKPFHVLCCPTDDQTIMRMFVNKTKYMRDEVGAKFVLCAYHAVDDLTGYAADYEGVVSVNNDVSTVPEDVPGVGAWSLVYWVSAWLAAHTIIPGGATTQVYNGELAVRTNFTQFELESAIKAGKFLLHDVNGTPTVLSDINTFTSVTPTKGEDFQRNQTIRVCDQIANDVAAHFNSRYLGTVPNDIQGRDALKADIILLMQKLEALRAIENFNPDTVEIAEGEHKDDVIFNLTELDIVWAMMKLYMTVVLV
jgi:hypothetical protein